MKEDVFSGLVSVPESLLFVGAADADTPESAIVLPELGREVVPYFRSLVDTADIVEHALVALPADAAEAERSLLRRVLRLRRPLVVSFFERTRPAELIVRAEPAAFREAALVAAVVESRLLAEPVVIVVQCGELRLKIRCYADARLYRCEAERA